ncbi:Putative ribonuclease H protein [Dendrobium catenatum]|uniref:Ribonuclease H protein n=1 Tax=Dendrobium catenatum TaxID=906689 RepID=A0A2I0WMF1_9ASPA|nr:Putative ribonuclease H protein [Dendrobium catenatum]
MFHKFKVSKNKKGAMAIKLDMEQAYDSMGWATLHQVLKWYGIPSHFSKLLLECVTEVRFSILINGNISNWINAYSGFRQGCPLSPYLFILCSQLLTNAINQRGHSLGIQISSRGPKITHLLYADDVLIFSHASSSLAKSMKIIVEDFCKWTGQRVNFSKSQVMFGKMVRKNLRRKIAKVLGIKIVKEMMYLGVKMSLRRPKIADFQELISNVMDRLNAWSKKSLSLGGKLILIDSSLLSMPNYLITNSLVPKRVLLELEKLCINFLWNKKGGSKGIHYVAWEDICKPRRLGGLGFHSPLLRIGALRSNLAWNFLQKPDSLLHRTLKHKYGVDIMHEIPKPLAQVLGPYCWMGERF